jgi:rubrerythrin
MITIDFSLAIALFCVLVLAGAGISWLFRKKEKEKQMHLDPRFMWFCSVCTYTYINTKEEVISLCPRCGSYNKKSEEKSM